MSGDLSVVSRLTRALEELHDGNVETAVGILEDLRRELSCGPGPRRFRCEVCGDAFRWPGELEDHQRVRHPLRERSVA